MPACRRNRWVLATALLIDVFCTTAPGQKTTAVILSREDVRTSYVVPDAPANFDGCQISINAASANPATCKPFVDAAANLFEKEAPVLPKRSAIVNVLRGQTLKLQLSDGRVAKVTCSTRPDQGPGPSFLRSCRIPPPRLSTVAISLKKKAVELSWPDVKGYPNGKRVRYTASETYQIVSVLSAP